MAMWCYLNLVGNLKRLNSQNSVVIFLSFPHNRAVYPLYFSSMNKKCPKCSSISVKKDGQRNLRQSYKCKDCGHVFQNASRISWKLKRKLFRDYSVHKQTLSELSESTGYSLSTIHRRITEALASKKGVLIAVFVWILTSHSILLPFSFSMLPSLDGSDQKRSGEYWWHKMESQEIFLPQNTFFKKQLKTTRNYSELWWILDIQDHILQSLMEEMG